MPIRALLTIQVSEATRYLIVLTFTDVQKISTIKIGSDAMSTYLRKKLEDQMNANSAQKTHLSVAVTVSVDRSARLFFEAKHGMASLGKGQLRLDATVQGT